MQIFNRRSATDGYPQSLVYLRLVRVHCLLIEHKQRGDSAYYACSHGDWQ